MTTKPQKKPRGHAWRKGPMCTSRSAQASYARYRKRGKSNG